MEITCIMRSFIIISGYKSLKIILTKYKIYVRKSFFLVETLGGKGLFWKVRDRKGDNKVTLKQTEYGDVNWSHLDQNRVQWQAHAYSEMILDLINGEPKSLSRQASTLTVSHTRILYSLVLWFK
jgi:hypothetical protein